MKTLQQAVNKNLRVSFLTIFLFTMYSLFSQTEQFYYYNGERIMLQEIEQKKYILVETADTLSFKQSFSILENRNLFFEKLYIPMIPYNNILHTDYCWCITDISEQDCNFQNYVYKSSAYFTARGDTVILSHLFYVKLKKSEDIDLLESLADSMSFSIVGQNKFMPLWYTLSCTKYSVGNALQAANLLYESGLFAAAEPDFFGSMKMDCVNDTHASSQWGLNNTGQNGGIAGIDIGYCQAKEISQGNANIIVAIVDQGIELDHPDLGNIFPLSYDTETGSSPSIVWGEHGTACAGIVGATSNNNLGVAGIAPLSPLMSISHSLTDHPSYYSKIADGINFAWQNGASVISNSWHFSTPCSIIDEAIDSALCFGRNGKGCIVVFVSGNDNDTIVSYPSRLDGVISVGAIDKCGVRAVFADSIHTQCDPWDYPYGSSYGQKLSMVAPGTNIYTTDNQGVYGYNNHLDAAGNYYSDFCGTSAACPHVAGVAALVLSVNPCFTREEVTYILESTCTKVRQDLYNYGNNPNHPNGTWNIEVGHGLVNAYEALLLAQSYLLPDTITTATIWNEKKRIYSDLIIDSLATLTITDTLYIASGSRIIVRPGGKLIVNGGTLTNACDGEMWEGIIVEGDSTQRQIASKQGSVILTNATIENAHTAISTKGIGGSNWWTKTGGIVQATNTLFHNNCCTAEFFEYENHKVNGDVTNNVSYFTRCNFTIDDNNLFAENNTYFLYQCGLTGVRGVKFNGCTFGNETTIIEGLTRGSAIYTEEAGFLAKRVCPALDGPQDPCYCAGTATDTVTRCSFSGFYKAIHAANDNAAYEILIDNCDFCQNHIGVELDAANNARVSFCDFDLSDSISYCGVILANTTGYTVESNVFHGRTLNSTCFGVRVNNSGTADNVIRKNVFSALNKACYASGLNGSMASGLHFECNTFNNGFYDIYGDNVILRKYHGSSVAGADNTFSRPMTSSLFLTSSSKSIEYWYSSASGHIPYNPSSNVTLHNRASANACSSSLCGLIPLEPEPRGSAALALYRLMAEELSSLIAEYAGRGYSEEDEADNAEADALMEQMSDLSAAMGDLSRTAIRTILSDSVVDMSLLKEWYRTIVETQNFASLQQTAAVPVAAYQLSEVYSTERDWTAAREVLASIPVWFVMDSVDADEYRNYLALQQLRENVEGNWYRQSQPEIAELQGVAEHNDGRAARMAKEILCFFHHICYEDEPLVDLEGIGERNARGDGNGSNGDAMNRVSTTTTANGTLTLYPNPAHNTLTVESTSPIREITVYDMAGHAVMVRANNYSPQQRVLNTSSLHAGIYLLNVVTDNGTETAKFVKN